MIGFTGVMLSEVLKRRYSIEKTFLLASLALFFCGVGFVLYSCLLRPASHHGGSWSSMWRGIIDENHQTIRPAEYLGGPDRSDPGECPADHRFFHRDLSRPGPVGRCSDGLAECACGTLAPPETCRRLSRFWRSDLMEGAGKTRLASDRRGGDDARTHRVIDSRRDEPPDPLLPDLSLPGAGHRRFLFQAEAGPRDCSDGCFICSSRFSSICSFS